MKKKTVRILAIMGVILLVLLYASSLIFALIGSPEATNLLKVSFVGTIVIPVFLYVYILFYKLTKKKNRENQ